MLFQQILVGLILVVIGGVSLKYNYLLVNNTFRLERVETLMGSGSTYLVFKLISMLLIIAGIATMAGFTDDILNWAASPLRQFFTQN